MTRSQSLPPTFPARLLLFALIILGAVLRLLFIGNAGFVNDVASFASWATTLAEHPFSQFYAKAGFADYPPGYFYILAAVGHLWEFVRGSDPTYSLLRAMVKFPAIIADLLVGWLLFVLARRFVNERIALGVAALYLLNPATIYISAVWGQVDAIAGGFALLGAYLLLRNDDDAPTAFSWSILCGWLALAYSLLIKPQAAVVIPFFIAFAFIDASRRRSRVIATAVGIGASFGLAWLLSAPFAASNNPIAALHWYNPIAVLHWLLERYSFGSNVYAYNSVNAFNLWTILYHFWSPDSRLLFGFIPQWLAGIVLVVAATGLLLWRYVQLPSPRAFLEACALSLLAFYLLATRMHERYLFDGLLFIIALVPFARRYLFAALVFTLSLFVNLLYSLTYLNVIQAHTPGVDARDLWPAARVVFSLLGVVLLFVLGNAFLMDETPIAASEPSADPVQSSLWSIAVSKLAGRARVWFDPREGMARFAWPLDYIVSASLGIFSFVLSYVNYWIPKSKVFDEVYFARAAQEYLQNVRIYENTHPPLTKLIITLSTMLFGGLAHGNNSMGWRFLDVVFGAIAVMILFAFAKRVLRSTPFAAMAAAFLIFDGMHFAQSRIATPEGIVIVFSLAAVYAFYRFWIVAQSGVREHVAGSSWNSIPVAAGLSVLSGFALTGVFLGGYALLNTALHPLATLAANPLWGTQSNAAAIVETMYFILGSYLLLRVVLLPHFFGGTQRMSANADGSYAIDGPNGWRIVAPDGGIIDSSSKTPKRGACSQAKSGNLIYTDEDLQITYAPDASATYATPVASAQMLPGEFVCEGNVERGSHAKYWLIAFAVSLGLLVSSKWYGVMGFGVSFTVLIGLWLQRFFTNRRASLWGNPRSIRLDVALISIMFIAATVYTLVWVPDMVRKAPGDIQNFSDVVDRQYTMFEYHDTLKATHPYQSVWWEWPIDRDPVAYYYKDARVGAAMQNTNACCVREIETLPNPAILWFGLLCVPLVGFLAWKERNKAYALIVLDYLLQWLPWMLSPRITFAYHFYVDIPLIALCNAIVLQRLWRWAKERGGELRLLGQLGVGAYALLVVLTFVYFYPILAATPITHAAWQARMWFPTWIVGPG